MPRFYVAPAWYPDEEFYSSARDLVALDDRTAAEWYVERNHANLDYPSEVTVKVERVATGPHERTTWNVECQTVMLPVATRAKEGVDRP